MKIKVEKIEIGNNQVDRICLANDKGMEVECLSLGGIITKIMVPDNQGNSENIVLGYKNLEDYIENPIYLGAIIGRNSGRIHRGKVTINDVVYEIGKNKNQNGNALHGGIVGFDKKNYETEIFEESDAVGVHLHTISEDGEEGFPGRVHITVTYILRDDNTFEMAYYGLSDKDTILNMTNHSYFNLSGNGKRPVTEQVLYVHSEAVTELDHENIATGNLVAVEDKSCLDFRKEKLVGRDIEDEYMKAQGGYDHAWKLNKDAEVDAWIKDEVSGRKMSVVTSEEGVVIYSLNFPEPILMDNDKEMASRGGICFETQSLPIGYNECFKGSSLLKAGKAYKSSTQFRFTVE